jgi:hypothetical protein
MTSTKSFAIMNTREERDSTMRYFMGFFCFTHDISGASRIVYADFDCERLHNGARKKGI